MALAQQLTAFIDRFYLKPFRAIMPKQTFRYLACGGINFVTCTFFHFVLYNFVLAKRNFDFGIVVISPHVAALGFSYLLSFLIGFWMQRNISFKSSPLRGRVQLFRYLLSSLVMLALSYALDKLFVEACGIYPTVAFIMIYMITATLGFILQKHYTFRGAEKE